MSGDLFQQEQAKADARLRTRRPTLKRAAKKNVRNDRPKKRNNAKARILENAALALNIAGFGVYDNFSQYRAAKDRGTLRQRYIVEHYPHTSLYGGLGFKEGFISDNGTDYIFEAKWQNISGSTDEKLPYLWEHFLSSPVANWIVWFDGNYWRDKRGLSAVEWLREKAKAECPSGRRFVVLNGKKEGQAFFSDQFGASP